MICELYGRAHQVAKKILRRSVMQNYRMVSVEENAFDSNGCVQLEVPGAFFNETVPAPKEINKEEVYPIENIVAVDSCKNLISSFGLSTSRCKFKLGIDEKYAGDVWSEFIENSIIPEGYRNGGLHYAGYIYEAKEWCLPSWIWTNAALIRMYCRTGQVEKAKKLVDLVIEKQQSCGGWIVRNDYNANGAIPVLAPNDSAYVANNGCIEVYLATKEKKYLNAACKCANWIMSTAREDGMVYVGYDMKREQWQIKHNIVDVGFTAGLFANVYEITREEKYLHFLKIFVDKFIELFYIPQKHGFATSLDSNDQQLGGMFGRGQAWALEGLIPACRVLRDEKIKKVVQETVDNLIKVQNKQGGWAYNISRPMMGVDCKATSIIACSLMNWYQDHHEQKKLKIAAFKAYKWCVKHTLSEGSAKGGIFSYTTEGAIVHHLYTCTSFVYGSSYAVELKKLLAEG